MVYVIVPVILFFCHLACAAYPGKIISFGLVADNHFDTFPAGEKAPWEPLQHWIHEQVKRTTTVTGRRYDLAVDKMDEAIQFFNTRKLNFVMNLGDIVNNDLMWNLKPILDSFNKAKAPKYHILGNHDRRAHNDRFGEKNATQEAWLMSKLGLRQWHYTFLLYPFRFVCVDSMIMEPPLRKDPRQKAHIDWLDKELKAASDRNEFVILFGHISIGVTTNVLGPVITRYGNVLAMFFGHSHKGGYTKQGTIHTVIIQGQIETLTNAFALCDVYYDRIEMTGFGRVPTRVFMFDPKIAEKIKKIEEDLAASGKQRSFALGPENQPPPPEQLWVEPLQEMPPIEEPLKNYVKPSVPKALPNAGTTQFYKEWKQGASPEEVRATESGEQLAVLTADPKLTGEVKHQKVSTAATPIKPIEISIRKNITLKGITVAPSHHLDLWSYVLVMPSVLLCVLAMGFTTVRCWFRSK